MNISDYNSEKDQTIKEKFVDREVFGDISSLMERIIRCEKKEVSIESRTGPLPRLKKSEFDYTKRITFDSV